MRSSLLLLACSGLAAQGPVPRKSADGLWLVAPAPETARISTTRAFSQGLTVDAENRVWCLLVEYRVNQPNSRQMWLYCSKDDGKSWQRVTKAPGEWASYGAIAGEPDSQILHVGWAGNAAGKPFASALYQRFDAGQGVWLGEPEVLQEGVAEENQFTVSDLALDANGALTVMVATHRHPKNPPWPSGWSSGLMIRDAGKHKWQGPFPVHTNTYGVWTNLQLRDGRAHTTYRTSSGRSLIGYRSFSLATEEYDQSSDVEISVPQSSGRHVANASSLVVGPFGSRTVLYPAAAHGNGPGDNGQLLIAFAGSDDKWRTEVLCDDPQLQTGNVSHEHFALAQGPGSQAIAIYSKVSEGFRVLYRRIVENGKPMGVEREIARSDLRGAYYRIVAARDGRFRTGVWAVVVGDQEAAALGVRAVLAPRPMKTRWQ